MKSRGIRTAALLVLQALWLDPSHSADDRSPQFQDEIEKQQQIYRSRGEKVPDGYVIDRSLLVYTLGLPSEFDRTLASLGPGDRWLDIGAGQGRAILDYYTSMYDLMHVEGRERRGKKAKAVAMSIEDRRTRLWQQTAERLEANQIQYLSGRRLREYSAEELGKYQVITDVVGGFSYTTTLFLFVEKVIELLELNGTFFTQLADVQSEDGTNKPYYPNSPFLTEIRTPGQSQVSVCSWLKRITCVEVSCESKNWQPPIETFRVRKVCNDVKVPALLPIHYEAGTPPERRFQLKD